MQYSAQLAHNEIASPGHVAVLDDDHLHRVMHQHELMAPIKLLVYDHAQAVEEDGASSPSPSSGSSGSSSASADRSQPDDSN